MMKIFNSGGGLQSLNCKDKGGELWEEELLGSKKLVDKEIRFTSSTSWTIPAGCKSIDIFLVGGGGAGGNWVTWRYTPGGPGSGGGTNTVKNISVSSDGSPSTLTVNNNTYTAPGGNGGPQSRNGLPNDDPYNYCYVTCAASPANNGIYRNSGIIRVGKNDGTAIEYVKDDRNVELDSYDLSIYGTNSSTTGDNPYRYRTGVPEFWEDDKPLHAAGGSNSQSLQIISDFTEGSGETVTRYHNSGDNGIQRGGGGYGGGGAGVTYSSSKSFSSGGSGIVIIRYKAYE